MTITRQPEPTADSGEVKTFQRTGQRNTGKYGNVVGLEEFRQPKKLVIEFNVNMELGWPVDLWTSRKQGGSEERLIG